MAEKTVHDMGAYVDGARTITINGVAYGLAPLQVGDIAGCQADIADKRYSVMLDKLRRVPVGDSVVAESLAALAGQPVRVLDVFSDTACRIKLIRTSSERAGSALHAEKLSPGLFGRLWDATLWISGLADAGDPSPFDATTATAKPSTA